MNEIMDPGRDFNRSNDPTENLKKKPRKSILKSSTSFEVQDAPAGSKRKPSQYSNKETKWDEENIKETLHPPNKDYGHMKIEEPKTPFERISHDEADAHGVDPGALSQRLQSLEKKPLRSSKAAQGSSAAAPASDSSDEEMTPQQAEQRKNFESKRKAHYNEFLAAKEALKNMKDEDEEEEEE